MTLMHYLLKGKYIFSLFSLYLFALRQCFGAVQCCVIFHDFTFECLVQSEMWSSISCECML